MQIGFHLPGIYSFRRDAKTSLGMVPLYWSMFLVRLSQNLTGIFIPVYIFQQGLSIFGNEAVIEALGLVFVLYLVKRLSTVLTTFPAKRINTR